MRRFSILGLMGFILVVGVGFAALRDANDVWASIMGLATLALLGIAVLAVVYGQGRSRAWWLGLALFCGVYHFLAAAPWVAEQVRPKLPSTLLLDYVHSRVVGAATGASTVFFTMNSAPPGSVQWLAANGPNPSGSTYQALVMQPTANVTAAAFQGSPGGPVSLRLARFLPGAANYEQFQRVGHSLTAILIGVIGAWISATMWARRERVEAA